MSVPAAFPLASRPIGDAPDYEARLPALPVFPHLPGQAFPIKRVAEWRTRKPTSLSGKQTYQSDWPYPRYTWTLQHSVLREGQVSGQTLTEMSQLFDFFNQQNGAFGQFLYRDQDDNSVTDQVIGIGDGDQLDFPLVRALGGSVERVLQADPSTSLQFYLDGVAIPSSFYVLTEGGTADDVGPGVLKFVNPPASGVVISGTFAYHWIVRFEADRCMFEEFLSGYHRVTELAFKSILL